MNKQRPVLLHASALSCALGNSVAECRQALYTGAVNTRRMHIDWFSESIEMPWYAIRSAQQEDPEVRFYRILESVVEQVLEESGLSLLEKQQLPIFLGSSSFEVSVSEARYQQVLNDSPETAFPIQISSIGHLTQHLRRTLGLQGQDFAYGTACAASTNALLGAARMIAQGVADHALVIGVELQNLTTLAGFHSLQLIADSQVRPFDRDRQGLIAGESCAAVILAAGVAGGEAASPLSLLGGASLCDTTSITSTDTSGQLIAEVIRRALSETKLRSSDISLIKAHGTASVANDLAEASGLRSVFPTMPPLFALKSYTGHTLGACGVTELILAAEVIREGVLPATPGFETTDPELQISPTQAGAQLSDSGTCLLNFFGFGGNNSVLVLRYGASLDAASAKRSSFTQFGVSGQRRPPPLYIDSTGSLYFDETDQGEQPELKSLLREHCRGQYRRIDRFTQLALIGAARCTGEFTLPPATPVYLASGKGPASNNIAMQKNIIAQHELPMPVQFIHAVSNSVGFYVMQEQLLCGQSLFVSRERHAFEAVLALAALDKQAQGGMSVLLGMVDELTHPLADQRTRLGVAAETALGEGSHWFLCNSAKSSQALGAFHQTSVFNCLPELLAWLNLGLNLGLGRQSGSQVENCELYFAQGMDQASRAACLNCKPGLFTQRQSTEKLWDGLTAGVISAFLHAAGARWLITISCDTESRFHATLVERFAQG